MMKHLLSSLIFLFVFCLFAGCNRQEATYRIGVSQCSNDTWRQQMNKEMMREASFYNKKVSLDIRSANEDSERQIRQIDSLIDEGVDLLIVSPNEAKQLTPVVEKAYGMGIPVVVVDRKILSDKYTAFIGADNRALGYDVGCFVNAHLNEAGTVAEFTGQMGATAAQERHEGFMQAINQASDVKLIAQIEAGWEGNEVDRQIDSLFKHGVVPDMIFAHNDRMGVKIHRAAVRLGHQVPVVGIDGLATPDGGLSNVERGELAASFVYPTGGEKVVQTALRILRKDPFERDAKLKSAVINPVTMRVYRMQSDQMHESEKRIDKLGGQLDRSLSRYAMQNMLLIACITIIVLIGIVLSVGLRVYFMTVSRNEELASQKRKLEEQRDQLVKLSKELQETTQSKLTFFTEVSHDLRTPLTLIQAPVEQLQGMTNLNAEQRGLLGIIRSNTDLLLRLVGQTLDFRKFEAGKLKLHLQRVDLGKSLQYWCEPFKALASKKMIRYHIECPQPKQGEQAVEGLLDPPKMESVVYNILSNAFKFTPEGGKVNVRMALIEDVEQGRRMRIEIEDTGQGIDQEKISHIFDRFYQVDASYEGSGIGLATVKAYVELHGGIVRAQSIPGKGSRFTVTIPCTNDEAVLAAAGNFEHKHPVGPAPHEPSTMAHLQEGMLQQPVVECLSGQQQVTGCRMPLPAEVQSVQSNEGVPTILIIDDNEDIRSYVRILLGNEYAVEEAVNGQEGLARARQLMPDAVVCDVMMPVMDGWECCRRLKDEWQTSHIPVMMLTACTLDEQRIAGFDCGADAYISKPFSPEMFRARLRNLIANRRRLQAFFADKATIAMADVSELDKGFAERFRALIEQNLGNSDLTVEDLATEMGLGRSQLYRKVKSLTGYSPVELLRVARLKKAAEILTRAEKTVSEVAYEVGFSTPSYLTKCFREYFGMSPSDYAKRE